MNYYNNVLQDPRNGGSRKAVEDFARLYVVPGMGHCGGTGAGGPNLFDAFGAVVTWREAGVAPKQITASLENFEWPGRRNPTVVPLPAGGALHPHWQHERREQLRLCRRAEQRCAECDA